MPVHLFGRPAPLARARRARPAADRGRRAGVRLRRPSPPPASPRPSASSRRRTCSGSATAASSPSRTTELAERVRMLRFHGSKAKKTSSTSATTRASTRSRPRRCGSSSPGSTAGPGAPRGGRAVRELGLGELVELPADEPGHVYHLFVCRSPRARPHRRGAARGRDRDRHVLPAAAPPPAGAALPRLGARATCPRRSGRGGELLAAALGRDHGRAQERVVDAVRQARRSGRR